ncbi:SDR family oxidoreductase [Shewanella surugensis]|uniref:SDR family oxidoreductase n=1 Tax=Shewanella surugensis TaxID=212020 RepID=A0ABT0LDA6_9GAMM|nr:SDR family oxidoreductase [Shewanella surugensis]MCL1125688.1 SDR family oxidoreductase [Shewanella surugensis]
MFKRVLLTGASGFLGNIILARLLVDYSCEISLLLRTGNSKEAVTNVAMNYLHHSSLGQKQPDLNRVSVFTCDSPGEYIPDDFYTTMGEFDTIIHAAGCVDYFDKNQLNIGNIQYTENMISLAYKVGAQKFIFLSTAFSSGYREEMIPEKIHVPPFNDPTHYTFSKRHAEELVHNSGIAYYIMRPSIVIGHSKTGFYNGKRYGLYQQWMLMEKLFHDHYIRHWHYVASEAKVQLLHCDSFEEQFFSAMEYLPENSCVNIVSDSNAAPTYRQVTDLWFEHVLKPESITYYSNYDDLDVNELSRKQRMLLGLIRKNTDLAARKWDFETTHAQKLKQLGVKFEDVTLASIKRCQDDFVKNSINMQNYIKRFFPL